MPKKFLRIIIPVLVLAVTITGGFFAFKRFKKPAKSSIPKDKYVAFLDEVYSTVQTNYWDKITDEQLINLYILGTEKLTKKTGTAQPKNKVELQKFLEKTLKETGPEEKKKEFSAGLADIVLANLQPFGRSRLYVKKQEIALKNLVENKNPEVNQYQVLEVPTNAPQEQIKETYEKKTEELKKEVIKEKIPEKKEEVKQKIAQVDKAYQILSDPDSRKTYDISGVEPTMEYKLLRPDIFYIHMNKFSPTTVEELVRVTQKVDKGETLNLLILDLRDNVGGAIDGLPYFLGPFIGPDQYAYQFFHQGEKEDFKTKVGWLPSLVRYKKVVVLINENTQSSAEVMAATLKRYNVGIVVGTTTKGWGTVEKVFPVSQQIDPSETYSIFLVHRLTLREDGQPIEGKGVDPIINIKNQNWEKELYNYFHYEELAKAIKEVLKTN